MADNIILTGFSGTGKTSVGKEVARLLEWDFVDTDGEIERRANKPVRRIFEEDGEPDFRLMEKSVLREACAGGEKVIATGGGAVVDQENRELMLERGVVFCLEALPETIRQRLSSHSSSPVVDRPLLSGLEPLDRIKALKSSRQGYYEVAHRVVHTDDLTVEETAQEVVKFFCSDARVQREGATAHSRPPRRPTAANQSNKGSPS